MSEQKPPSRTDIEAQIHHYIAALETGDIETIVSNMHPDIQIVWPRASWTGSRQIQEQLNSHISTMQPSRFYLRRLLIDSRQSVAALEWVYRYKQADKYQEVLGGAALDFDAAGQLCRSQIYLDFNRSGSVPDFDTPWPVEQWSPGVNPGPPPSRAQSERLLHAHATAWSNNDAATIGQLLHDEIIGCPPWDYQEGRKQVEEVISYHFAKFVDTQVTPQRVIFDKSQPYFGVCQQTFACADRKTGQRGQDTDFAFFEICQGKLRYWRNYFDTDRSVQDDYRKNR